MSIDFHGRVAIVTGAGGGLGKQHALALAKRGAKVLVNDLGGARDGSGGSATAAEAVVAEIRAAGGEAIANGASVTDFAAVQAMVQQAMAAWGRVDILVNNAAGNFVCPTADLSPNGWRTVIDIDLNGTFYGCQAAYPHLKASVHGGSVISIITMLGVSGWPGAAHAAAAKGGILALSRTLAVEWGNDQIRVNTISPGPIGDTEGVRRMYIESGRGDLEAKKTALGRFGRTADIANAAVYLGSDLSAYVTGENLIVDGGRWLKYVAA